MAQSNDSGVTVGISSGNDAEAKGTLIASMEVVTPLGTAESEENFTVGVPTGKPSISRISPGLGPVGQWVYVMGANFVHGNTAVAIAGVVAITVAVYGPENLGFTVPNGADGISQISVTTPNGEAISKDFFQIGVPTGPPSATKATEYTGHDWVYLKGSNFVHGETQIHIGSDVINATVYAPNNLGFTATDAWYTSSKLTVKTPNGDYVYNLSHLLRIKFVCNPGTLYILQESQDMELWADAGEAFMSESDALTFMADSEINAPTRFFRLREVDLNQ